MGEGAQYLLASIGSKVSLQIRKDMTIYYDHIEERKR